MLVAYISLGVVVLAPLFLWRFFTTWNWRWLYALAIYAASLVYLAALTVSAVLVFVHAVMSFFMFPLYVPSTLMEGFSNISKSCYFMPCAPQSIVEWEQAYSLVVGLVLLFGVEITPAVVKWRKQEKAFEDSLDRQIDLESSREKQSKMRGRAWMSPVSEIKGRRWMT
jgi:hypothetical protein